MTAPILIPLPEVDRAPQSALVLRAEELVVDDKASHAVALGIISTAASLTKAIEAKLKPATDAAYAAHRAMTGLRADLVAPLTAARDIATRKAADYDRRAREAAEAEARRIEAETMARNQERALSEAVSLDAAGDAEGAAAILDEPNARPVVIVAPEVAGSDAGASRRVTYAAEVTDFAALVAHGDPAYLLPNQAALNAMARALKTGLKLPGVRIVESVAYTARAK